MLAMSSSIHADPQSQHRGQRSKRNGPQARVDNRRHIAHLDAAERGADNASDQTNHSSTAPNAAASIVIDAAITRRAGCPVSVGASVQCWACELNMRIPATAPNTAVKTVAKANTSVTKFATAQEARPLMTAVRARMASFDRIVERLIHPLLSVVGKPTSVVTRTLSPNHPTNPRLPSNPTTVWSTSLGVTE